MTGSDSRTPKPRGCFQCSKRRIICDRGEPTCLKCAKKGIECSGLGRFRFTAGVAMRGKLKGCTIPVPNADPEAVNKPASIHTGASVRWRDGGNRVAKKHKLRTSGSAAVNLGREGVAAVWEDPEWDRRMQMVCQAGGQEKVVGRTGDAMQTSIMGSEEFHSRSGVNLHCAAPSEQLVQNDLPEGTLSPSLQPWIAPMDAKTRQLFDYFAQVVAPVMVVLDISNGYRDILLPMAFENELLQEAIVVVATQHLVPRQPVLQEAAESRRSAVISRLRHASQIDSPDIVFNLSTWATLIVLLVGETVTGSPEYIHLLRTLLTLSRSITTPGTSPLQEFLAKQTEMFAFLGQPLLNETQGLECLRNPIDPGVWMPSGVKAHHTETLSLVKQVICKGVQIYLQRAITNQNSWHTLEDLRQLLCHIDPAEPGAHGFVWPCFMAAADSTDPAHRDFFARYMERIYSKTLFHNIPRALAVLPTIWQLQGPGKWTEILPRISPVLIM
ncbi:hypothetical protein BO70DRAFT_35266 [Aspergillus heteromorphus CBS 117.55]|uniref:Zn(2)-C6 fungal-type domain-containing protein n=1 Tax=Aspergillus heteromorphus CBS 117.55 TaxID=1448321 RepID=A0A317WAS3_9EURO|nr:uncharacterized protein BO70DRAFT_35266 [Aspergillus heteromorphus CBS 117.55]PWY82098.1 hypothetical protein BO70DRAFT_35266 [Aspergillus heteromorphus CBS 117.55]